MKRRTFTAAVIASPLLSACIYDQFFDIEWDEEVLLHDGRVIVVHVKNTYERRGKGFKQYDETKITFRHKELIFESEPGKRVTFKTRMPVAYLGQFEKDWYVVIAGQGPYGNYPDEMPDHWGNDYSPSIARLAILQNGAFIPARWANAPEPLKSTGWQVNLMTSSFWGDFPQWNRTKLTLNHKKVFKDTHGR
jgi:hypothetical protein